MVKCGQAKVSSGISGPCSLRLDASLVSALQSQDGVPLLVISCIANSGEPSKSLQAKAGEFLFFGTI